MLLYTSMPERITLYKQPDYFDDLIEKVDATESGDRIAIATMAFDPHDPTVETLLPKLGAAAHRSVEVLLAIDAYAFMFDDSYQPTGPLVPFPLGNRKATRQLFQEKEDALNILREEGVVVGQTNTPSRLHIPYAGRSHIKAAVVNNSWRAGGCNLADTDNLDIMVGGEDAATADFLYDALGRMIQTGSVQAALGKDDLVHPIDETTDLLIDVGRPGQSLIYERALGTIDTAEEWLALTCQFFPSGKTAQHMAQAAWRDVNTFAFYNSPSEKRLGGGIMDLYRRKEQLTMPPDLFRGEIDPTLPFMHAKIVASELEGNAGSHNYISAGVMLGTAEIAIHSTNKALARQAGLTALQLANKQDDPAFRFIK
jgi:hypothetical protein